MDDERLERCGSIVGRRLSVALGASRRRRATWLDGLFVQHAVGQLRRAVRLLLSPAYATWGRGRPDAELAPLGCRMILCAAGDIHGALDRLYADVLEFERILDVSFDWVLHVGDFGIWPDAERVDAATRRHDGAGDFPRWIAELRVAPRPTVFIKGNHEDFEWLDARPTREVHRGLHYLRNGEVFELATRDETLRLGGIGGCHGPSNFERPSRSLAGSSKRHYTRDEIERLSVHRELDIVMTHDAPRGVRFPQHRRGEGFESDAAGLDELLARTKPRVCFFGHHHTRLDADVRGVPCIGLNKVARPGNLVAFEMKPGDRGYEVLGEWPGR